MVAEALLHAALAALEEAGDPMRCRDVIEDAIAGGTAPELAVRPSQRKQQVSWAAKQLHAHSAASDAARAYRALRELVAALFEPIAGAPPTLPPAPEVAITLDAKALLDAIAPQPRVVCHDLARETAASLTDVEPERRVLALRALRKPNLPKLVPKLAAVLALDPVSYVRAEALHLTAGANQALRQKLAAELVAYFDHSSSDARAAALDAIRGLQMTVDDRRLVGVLVDPVPAVRAAAMRTIVGGTHSAAIDEALFAGLRDLESEVCFAALGAVTRYTSLHGPALLEPLRSLALREDGDPRATVYLLGKLKAIDALHAAVACGRSDVARGAELVLQQLGAPVHELTLEERVARAARELASDDADARRAGLLEARRLDARTLVPAIRALVAEPLAREVLVGFGEPVPIVKRRLAQYRDIAPTVRAIHGAYATAAAGDALGLWDHGTGKLLFAVDGATLLELVPGRAEAALVITTRGWSFERRAIPSGDTLATLAIPESFARGRATSLSIAADLVTVWCDDDRTPYRFHIKLSPEGDRVIDDAPKPGKRSRRS